MSIVGHREGWWWLPGKASPKCRTLATQSAAHTNQNSPTSTQDFKPDRNTTIYFCIEDWPFEHGRGIYSVISMIFQYVLPITIVSIVYVKISDKLQKRLIRRQRLTQLECQQKRQLNLIRRTHTMLVSVSLVFGLSWLPLNLLNVISDFSPLSSYDEQLFRIVFAICHLIGCSSACSNPILYGFLNENFRKELHQVYTHHIHLIARQLRLSIRCLWCLSLKTSDNLNLYPPSTPTGSPMHSPSSASSSSTSSADGLSSTGSLSSSEPSAPGRPALSNGSASSASTSLARHGAPNSPFSQSDAPSRCLDLDPSAQPLGALDVTRSAPPMGLVASMGAIAADLGVPGVGRACSLQMDASPAAADGHAHHQKDTHTRPASGCEPADEHQHHHHHAQSIEANGWTYSGATGGSNSQLEPDSARRYSFQTVTSSRQTLGKTMRFCLCISDSSSNESLGGAPRTAAVGLRPSIRMERPAGALGQSGVKLMLGAQVTGAPGGDQAEANEPAPGENKKRHKRATAVAARTKRCRGRIQRDLEAPPFYCDCRCHQRPNMGHSAARRRRTGRAGSIVQELAAAFRWRRGSSAAAEPARRPSSSLSGVKQAERHQTQDPGDDNNERQAPERQQPGRRVWLRLPAAPGACKDKAAAQVGGDAAPKGELELARLRLGGARAAPDAADTLPAQRVAAHEPTSLVAAGGRDSGAYCPNCRHSRGVQARRPEAGRRRPKSARRTHRKRREAKLLAAGRHAAGRHQAAAAGAGSQAGQQPGAGGLASVAGAPSGGPATLGANLIGTGPARPPTEAGASSGARTRPPVVGTYYLTVDMSTNSRSRADSDFSLSRERSTSVVVLAGEHLADSNEEETEADLRARAPAHANGARAGSPGPNRRGLGARRSTSQTCLATGRRPWCAADQQHKAGRLAADTGAEPAPGPRANRRLGADSDSQHQDSGSSSSVCLAAPTTTSDSSSLSCTCSSSPDSCRSAPARPRAPKGAARNSAVGCPAPAARQGHAWASGAGSTHSLVCSSNVPLSHSTSAGAHSNATCGTTASSCSTFTTTSRSSLSEPVCALLAAGAGSVPVSPRLAGVGRRAAGPQARAPKRTGGSSLFEPASGQPHDLLVAMCELGGAGAGRAPAAPPGGAQCNGLQQEGARQHRPSGCLGAGDSPAA